MKYKAFFLIALALLVLGTEKLHSQDSIPPIVVIENQKLNQTISLRSHYEQYMEKSFNQKNASNVLVVLGGVIAVTGFIVGLSTFRISVSPGGNDNKGTISTVKWLLRVGGGLVCTGLGLAVAAHFNKKKALSFNLGSLQVPKIKNQEVGQILVPAVSLKLGL